MHAGRDTMSDPQLWSHHAHKFVTNDLSLKTFLFSNSKVVFRKTNTMFGLMKRIVLSILLASFVSSANAQTTLEAWEADRTQIFDAADIDPADFVWRARPIIVFAQSPLDPLFVQQMELLAERKDDLAERDVIVITDTTPEPPSALRTALRPRNFMLAIIDKDGKTAIRKPSPWDVREISRSIDKTPLREQEVRDRRVSE